MTPEQREVLREQLTQFWYGVAAVDSRPAVTKEQDAMLAHIESMLAAERAAVVEDRTQAVADVVRERQRQVNSEGWTPEHDDAHDAGEMALAASCYALAAAHNDYRLLGNPEFWPWDRKWWKPKSPRRDLVRAAALILAEIDRLDRAAIRKLGEKRE